MVEYATKSDKVLGWVHSVYVKVRCGVEWIRINSSYLQVNITNVFQTQSFEGFLKKKVRNLRAPDGK